MKFFRPSLPLRLQLSPAAPPKLPPILPPPKRPLHKHLQLLTALTPGQIRAAEHRSSQLTRRIEALGPRLAAITPDLVEEFLYYNLCCNTPKRSLNLAARLAAHPRLARFHTPRIHTLLLSLLDRYSHPLLAPWAAQVFLELCRMPLDHNERLFAAHTLLDCFAKCKDFSQLLVLRMLYDAHLANSADQGLHSRYVACVVSVYLNLGLYMHALDVFQSYLEQAALSPDCLANLAHQPVSKLILAMVSAHDPDSLVQVLESLHALGYDGVTPESWGLCLSLGLSLNHYPLVSFIYRTVIMRGLDQISGDVVLDNVPAQLLAVNPFFASLSATSLRAVLHTLASHGDVALCLELVEWHFLHRAAIGRNAFTKDLCLNIIHAYCCYLPFQENEVPLQSTQDDSVKIVLDAIETFSSRQGVVFSYRDVADSFLHKLNDYRAFDPNIASRSAREEARIVEAGDESEEDLVPPQKKSNQNVYKTPYALFNLAILDEFVLLHIAYIKEQKHSGATLKLFINCLLNNIAKHLNASGVVRALVAIHKKWGSLDDILDPTSFSIIFRSFASSPAAMQTGYVLYIFLRSKNIPIEQQSVEHLVLLSLRGEHYNSLLEYYVFELLKTRVTDRVKRRIANFSHFNERAAMLLEAVKKCEDGASAQDVWKVYGLTTAEPEIFGAEGEYAKYSRMDDRDAKAIHSVFEAGFAPAT